MHCSFALSFVPLLSALKKATKYTHTNAELGQWLQCETETAMGSLPLCLSPCSLTLALCIFISLHEHFVLSRGAASASVLRLCYKILTKKNHTTFFFSNFFSQPFFIGAATAKYEFNPQFRSEGLFYCGTECRLLCAMEFSVLGKNYAQDFS